MQGYAGGHPATLSVLITGCRLTYISDAFASLFSRALTVYLCQTCATVMVRSTDLTEAGRVV